MCKLFPALAPKDELLPPISWQNHISELFPLYFRDLQPFMNYILITGRKCRGSRVYLGMWKCGRAVFKHCNTQSHCPTCQTAVEHSTRWLQQKKPSKILVLPLALHTWVSGRWCGPDRLVPGKLVVPKTPKSQTNGQIIYFFFCIKSKTGIQRKKEKNHSALIPLLSHCRNTKHQKYFSVYSKVS